MTSFSILFILFCLPTPLLFANYVKMILTYGKVLKSTDSTTYNSWNECLRRCYDDVTCVLVSQPYGEETCQLYKYGKVSLVQKQNSSSLEPCLVGYRFVYPMNVCSLSNNPPTFGSSYQKFYREEPPIGYSITLNSTENNTVTITYQTIICPSTSTLWLRGKEGHVCTQVKLFDSPFYGTFLQAQQLCKSDGGMSLTGPMSSIEYDFYKTDIISKVTALKGASAISGKSNSYFWLDGMSKTTIQVFEMEDNTHMGTNYYNWSKGNPNSDMTWNCIYMMYQGQYTDDIGCLSSMANGYYWRGAVCRMNPSKIVNI